MFERFTQSARHVVVLAQEESRSLQHGHIGTEHLLLGLLREDGGVAARVLGALGVTLDEARARVRELVVGGSEPTPNAIPFTPRAKRVLERALREALHLGHNDIGSEHVLLGLVGGGEDGLGPRILLDAGAAPEAIRAAVLRMTGSRAAPPADAAPRAAPPAEDVAAAVRTVRAPMDLAWFDGLGLAGLLDSLARDIRTELGRAPDSGDLLLALACVPGGPAAGALRELGIDLDALRALIELRRATAAPAEHDAPAHPDVARAIRAGLGLSNPPPQ